MLRNAVSASSLNYSSYWKVAFRHSMNVVKSNLKICLQRAHFSFPTKCSTRAVDFICFLVMEEREGK